MDPRVIDAGEVPNNAVDTNIPRMHGGNHPPPRNPYHHVVSENVLRKNIFILCDFISKY